MHRSRSFAVAAVVFTVFVLSVGCGSASTRGGATATPTTSALVDIGAGLQGPEGITATLYAQGLPQAAALAFDSSRRLWVATAAYSDSGQDSVNLVPQPGATPETVISGLHTALGILWINDALYVATASGVARYTSFDGTQFANTTSIIAIPDGTGEVNGIVLGPDGRIRLGISAPCDHCKPVSNWSGTVLSFQPDGSDVRVEASGIRAPIGLAYYPGTGDLFVTMNQRDDLGDATPGDWLSLVKGGEAWGFPACYGQRGDTCTGVPAPVAVLDKHAAVSGVAFAALPSESSVSAVVAEWSLGKVLRVAVTNRGGKYSATVMPFLEGLRSPVAVATAPDGSIFVSDWGSGNVYRISNRGS